MPFPLQADFTVISRKEGFPNILNAVEFRIDFGMDWGTMPQDLDEGKLWKFSEGSYKPGIEDKS